VILLDTDHLNILQVGRGPQYDRLAAHMDASADTHFATTIITYEEHMRGWLASIRRAGDVAQQIRPYDQLIALIRFFQAWEIVGLSTVAVDHFNDLRKQRVRIGTLDLKIASIALANHATLLTANTRDFDKVASLRTKDWLG
jgi:tRNA(fMet)-specific endonuclease VapC